LRACVHACMQVCVCLCGISALSPVPSCFKSLQSENTRLCVRARVGARAHNNTHTCVQVVFRDVPVMVPKIKVRPCVREGGGEGDREGGVHLVQVTQVHEKARNPSTIRQGACVGCCMKVHVCARACVCARVRASLRVCVRFCCHSCSACTMFCLLLHSLHLTHQLPPPPVILADSRQTTERTIH
jgi:hypothetical protein